MFYGASSFDQCLLDTSFPGSATGAENMFNGTAGALSVSDLSKCPSPITNANIKEAVALWKSDQSNCTATYGHISFWDTGSVTDMDRLFYEATEFNEDISQWNVSNVEDMTYVSMRARLSSAHRST